MRCRVSRWITRKNGERCRVYTCADRKVIECVKSKWAKGRMAPDADMRVSVVCGRGCVEKVLVVKTQRGQKRRR